MSEVDLAQTRKEAEAYLITLALGLVGVGFLILVYVAGPTHSYLSSHDAPVPLSPADLASPEQVEAAGAWVSLGPMDLDYPRARVRTLRARSGETSFAAYLAIRDAAGRTQLVVRDAGYPTTEHVPNARVQGARIEGILLRSAPVLLSGLEDFPGDRLRGQNLIDMWILLARERPPPLDDFLWLGVLGSALFILPLLAIAAYFRYGRPRLLRKESR
jgi:hypothetical protein